MAGDSKNKWVFVVQCEIALVFRMGAKFPCFGVSMGRDSRKESCGAKNNLYWGPSIVVWQPH